MVSAEPYYIATHLSSLNEITERLVGLIRYYILLMIIMPTESHPNYRMFSEA